MRRIVAVLACLRIAAAQERTADTLLARVLLTHALPAAIVNAAPERRIALLLSDFLAQFLNLALVHLLVRLALFRHLHRLDIAALGLGLD